MTQIATLRVVPIILLCPGCGVKTENWQPRGSMYVIECNNGECDMVGTSIMVDKSSHVVLSVQRFFGMTPDGKRLYPALYDEEGNRVWPNKE